MDRRPRRGGRDVAPQPVPTQVVEVQLIGEQIPMQGVGEVTGYYIDQPDQFPGVTPSADDHAVNSSSMRSSPVSGKFSNTSRAAVQEPRSMAANAI